MTFWPNRAFWKSARNKPSNRSSPIRSKPPWRRIASPRRPWPCACKPAAEHSTVCSIPPTQVSHCTLFNALLWPSAANSGWSLSEAGEYQCVLIALGGPPAKAFPANLVSGCLGSPASASATGVSRPGGVVIVGCVLSARACLRRFLWIEWSCDCGGSVRIDDPGRFDGLCTADRCVRIVRTLLSDRWFGRQLLRRASVHAGCRPRRDRGKSARADGAPRGARLQNRCTQALGERTGARKRTSDSVYHRRTIPGIPGPIGGGHCPGDPSEGRLSRGRDAGQALGVRRSPPTAEQTQKGRTRPDPARRGLSRAEISVPQRAKGTTGPRISGSRGWRIAEGTPPAPQGAMDAARLSQPASLEFR